MAEYKECFVAFLDMLGFSDCIQKQMCCSKLDDLFVEVKEESIVVPIIEEKFGRVPVERVRKFIMSDSIVLYIDADKKNSLNAVIKQSKLIMHRLLLNSPPILIRGYVTKGDFYRKDWRMFGEALSYAAKKEKDEVFFPRIIVQDGLLDEKQCEKYYMDDTYEDIDKSNKQIRCINGYDMITDDAKSRIIKYLEKDVDCKEVKEKRDYAIQRLNS